MCQPVLPNTLGRGVSNDQNRIQRCDQQFLRGRLRRPGRRLLLQYPDRGLQANTGFRSVFTGTNFAPGIGNGDPTGRITSVTVTDGFGRPVVAISQVNWSVGEFLTAIDGVLSGNDSALTALLSRSGPIELDASGATIGADFRFDGITTSGTIIGSAFEDTLSGTDGNDLIRTGASTYEDYVFGGLGNDTIDLGGLSAARGNYGYITYEELTVGAGGTTTFNVNAGTATVVKSGNRGTDTILSSQNVLQGDGLALQGTEGNDVFNVNGGTNSYMVVGGLSGNDTMNITLDGIVRLDYRGGFDVGPNRGIVADLSTGIVSNDGYGGQDVINILGGTSTLSLRGTRYADDIIGSDRDERFILERGQDTLDAGDGYDMLRYDRSRVDAINFDGIAGTVTGTWRGEAFTHTVSNVEYVRGSLDGNDSMQASDAGMKLNGYGGNDTLLGGMGDDRLWGGTGNDFISTGNNDRFDVADGDSGFDTIDAGQVISGGLQIEHYDLVNAGIGQTITVTDDTTTIDKGSNGITTVTSTGTVMQYEEGRDFFRYWINGSASNDVFNIDLTDGGEVTVRGGRGNDTFNLGGTVGQTFMQDGFVVIDYWFDNKYQAGTQGVVLDLSTGIVSNDGFGSSDIINGLGRIASAVIGSTLADSLTGSDRADNFELGTGGNDTVHGGADDDTIAYYTATAGIRADLSTGVVTGDGFVQTVSDIEAVIGSDYSDVLTGGSGSSDLIGRDGDDVMYGDDLDVGQARAESAQVWRLYQAVLDRTPDTISHARWVERLLEGEGELIDLAKAFVNSPEFQTRFADVDTSEEFVTLLYNNVLGRDPDATGLANFTNALNSGARTEAQVVLAFSESTEYQNSTRIVTNLYAEARDAAAWSDDVFRMYQATLGRAPDAGGFLNWTEQLGNGNTLINALTGFVNSAEFQQRFGTELSSEDFVTLLYDNVLERSPDPMGLAGWVDNLDNNGFSRAQVVNGFSQSPEFIARTDADVKDWIRGQGVDDILVSGGGDNTLAGGILADQFVFEVVDGATHDVLDLEAWDYIDMFDFSYGGAAQVIDQMTQVGRDTVFQDQGVTITFRETTIADFTDDMFLLS